MKGMHRYKFPEYAPVRRKPWKVNRPLSTLHLENHEVSKRDTNKAFFIILTGLMLLLISSLLKL